jgi:hypothetical protein
MARVASSNVVLTSGSTWSSGTLYPDLADRIVGSVFADQSGTIYIEQSPDGTNWDVQTSYTVSANDGKGFSEEIIAPYVRVRYTNDATNQGAFRISVRMTSAGSR